MSGFSDAADDILGNIMSRLPAKSFAAAACVNHLWNKVSDLILSRPRLVSGLSLAATSEVAVNEALEMALSTPIRPHFAIAFVGIQFHLKEIHERIARKLGANTILVTSAAVGIIGVDSMTKKLEEVKWDDQDVAIMNDDIYRGLTLVIGFVPGLKIRVIPLARNLSEEPEVVMVDKFISDVRNFTVSVSGDANPDPVGIMMFGDPRRNLKPTLAEIDRKISRETVMIGELHNYVLCTNPVFSNIGDGLYSVDAIALVFAKDIQNPEVEIKFHMGISGGIIPIGPKVEVIDVWELDGKASWLFVRTQGLPWPLDASSLLLSLISLIKDEFYFIYIGVKKEIIPQDGGAPIKYTEYHEIIGTHQNMFIVAGSGINRGDTCMFYQTDSKTAKDTRDNVKDRFKSLVEPPRRRRRRRRRAFAQQTEGEKVFGGLVFGSSSRGERFLGKEKKDCVPFSKNFPGVPMGGTFCFQPFGRCPVLEDGALHYEEERFNMQVFNSVYLTMSYKETA